MKEILITSSVLILALLILRLVFGKKVRRTLIYGAWALVALRLLVPVQIGQLNFSVLTAAQPVIEAVDEQVKDVVLGTTPEAAYRNQVEHYIEKDQTVFVPEVQEQIKQEIAQGNQTPNQIYDKIQQQFPEQEILTPEGQETVQMLVGMSNTTRLHNAGTVLASVWFAGIAVMAIWFAIVNLRHGRMLRRNREKLECNSPIPVYVSEQVDSPCLVGLFRPAVYLTPESATPERLRHVLTHELTHYAHKDHIWSLVRCVCLCVYWFNPLVWVAAWFSRRDCELACDEGALKRLGEEERIAYGKTLLDVVSHAATPAHLLQTATAMNETKKQLKERVNFIVKKPKISMIAAVCMVLVCAIVAGCVAAGPATNEAPPATEPTGTTQSTAPGETTQPTEPTQTTPNATTEPTEPIQPTEPTQPVESTPPTEPSVPIEPTHPADCKCYEGIVVREASCTSDGEIMRVCSFYGTIRRETVERLGHDFGEPFVSLEPTCGKNGERIRVCSRCDEEEVVEILPRAGGCEWEFVEKKEQKGSFAGYERYRCTKCGTLKYVYFGEKGTYDLEQMEQMVAEYIRGRGFNVIIPDSTPENTNEMRKVDFSNCEIMGGPEYLLEKALDRAKYLCDWFEQSATENGIDVSAYTIDVWLSYSQNGALGGGTFYIIIVNHR